MTSGSRHGRAEGVADEEWRSRWLAAHILPFEAEVRGWLRARVRSLSRADVDDLLQEALARILRCDLASIQHGRAYFYSTVRHLIAEQARRNRIVPIERLGEIASLRILSEEPGPDRQVGARQELERLRRIVAGLPPQCRRAFELRKLEGYSQRETAQRMGIAEKTVETHLAQALLRIHQAINRDAGSGQFD